MPLRRVRMPQEPRSPRQSTKGRTKTRSSSRRRVRNTKAKGNRFERAVRDFYEARGWIVAHSAASLKIDITATHPETGRCHYIEAKVNHWPTRNEYQNLYRLAGRCAWGDGKFKVLVWRKRDREKPVIRMLKKNQEYADYHIDKFQETT